MMQAVEIECTTVQSLYNTPCCNRNWDITQSCCGSQSFYHGILRRNYRKMTILWSFSYKSIVKLSLYTGFPRALENLENLENHKKKFHAWKNHGIWKKLKNHGKIMEFCEIICVFDCLFSGYWWFKFLLLFQNACLVHNWTAIVVPDIL